MGTLLIGIALFAWILIMRSVIRNHSEKTGLNICPKCGKPMEQNAMARYYCPQCGYHQPFYYTKNNNKYLKTMENPIATIKDQVPRYNKELKRIEDIIKKGGLDKSTINELYKEVEWLNGNFMSLQTYSALNKCGHTHVEYRDNSRIRFVDWVKDTSVRFFTIREWINRSR